MVREKIFEIVNSMVDCTGKGIVLADGIDLFQDLVIDSVLIIQLITEIEEEFDVEFDFDLDYESVSKIGDLVAYVESLM